MRSCQANTHRHDGAGEPATLVHQESRLCNTEMKRLGLEAGQHVTHVPTSGKMLMDSDRPPQSVCLSLLRSSSPWRRRLWPVKPVVRMERVSATSTCKSTLPRPRGEGSSRSGSHPTQPGPSTPRRAARQSREEELNAKTNWKRNNDRSVGCQTPNPAADARRDTFDTSLDMYPRPTRSSRHELGNKPVHLAATFLHATHLLLPKPPYLTFHLPLFWTIHVFLSPPPLGAHRVRGDKHEVATLRLLRPNQPSTQSSLLTHKSGGGHISDPECLVRTNGENLG